MLLIIKKIADKITTRTLKHYYFFKYETIWNIKERLQEQNSLDKRLLQIYEEYFFGCGSWIGHETKFAGVPCFPHGIMGIFISGRAEIGKNAVIFQHVTIGSDTLNGSDNGGSPVIGDNVYIGCGAKIIGKIRIGNNCRIGANAVVYKDMPPDSVAVQSPTRIIQKHSLDNRYYSYGYGKWVYYDDGKWVEDANKRI